LPVTGPLRVTLRRSLVTTVAKATSGLPRIKGLGMILALPAKFFRAWDAEVEARVFGSRMNLNSGDYLSNIVLFTPNYFDRHERALIAEIVRPGDLVIDVGANIGIYTLLLARSVGPKGQVIAVEAEPTNFARLQGNVALNGMRWVKLCPCGVSDKEETLALNLDDSGNAGAHSFVAKDGADPAQTRIIKCVRLASLVDADRAPRFMKLDIEGFEHRVLKAYFDDVEERMRPDYIMLEDARSLREDDAVALAAASGYTLLHRIDDNVFFEKRGLTDMERIQRPS
jgi:FkbM family methyltransferase